MWGRTPLYIAAERDDTSILSMLLEKNSQINSRDGAGGTVLHHAASYGSEAAVQLLLAKRANINTADKLGRIPPHAAASQGRYSVTTEIPMGYQPIPGCCDDIIQLLLEKGAHVDARSRDGSTALHLAVKSEYAVPVQLLIENKADIGVRDEYGKTALDYANERGYKDIMQLLQEAALSQTLLS
ncbi:ankyrin repeat-containing domain protein [Xylogone sp. PMI_703]|nr:ankyrin repeat-containing domain protein [Xylogone sp. PMI_703]